MATVRYLELVPALAHEAKAIFMTADELVDYRYTATNGDQTVQYIAEGQNVSGSEPVKLTAAHMSSALNDSEKENAPAPQAPQYKLTAETALPKLMKKLAAKKMPLGIQREANLWLKRQADPDAKEWGLRIIRDIKQLQPRLLNDVDPDHSLEMALFPQPLQLQKRPGAGHARLRMPPAAMAPAPTLAMSSRRLRQRYEETHFPAPYLGAAA